MHKTPLELSGGQKQWVAIARAIVKKPNVILADEPSGSPDEENKKELHKLLLQMQKQYGQTIIIVTHDKELAEISNRVIEIKDGKILDRYDELINPGKERIPSKSIILAFG